MDFSVLWLESAGDDFTLSTLVRNRLHPVFGPGEDRNRELGSTAVDAVGPAPGLRTG